MNLAKSKIPLIALILLALIASFFIFNINGKDLTEEKSSRSEQVYADEGIAIDGYDAVAYFTSNEAQEGESQYSYDWNGTTWHFSSQENKSLFMQQPEKYAPQYGGFCATAVSNGATFESDPSEWSIHNNKLYLFYDDDTKQAWLSKLKADVITTGDNNWDKLK